MWYQICIKCNENKSDGEFSWKEINKRRSTECKKCSSERAKKQHAKRKLRQKLEVYEKICMSCNLSKPSTKFNKAQHLPDGLSNKCKACLSEYRKSDLMIAYYEERKACGKQQETLLKYWTSHQTEIKTRAKNKRANNINDFRAEESLYRKRLKQQALDALGGKCRICGITNAIHLCIDHINDDGALERKDPKLKYIQKLYLSIIKNPDTLRYQVLCYNHNREKETLKKLHSDKNDSPHDHKTKICTQCCLQKFIGEFAKDKYKSAGRKSECKLCSSFRGYVRRDKALSRLGRICVKCSNDNKIHLEIDHIKAIGSKKRKEEALDMCLKILNGSISTDGLQILCSNCNNEKAHTIDHR